MTDLGNIPGALQKLNRAESMMIRLKMSFKLRPV